MRVVQVLRGDAGLYYGGGEVQAERTREALSRLGVEVSVHTPLNKDLGDVVHFFGLFDAHWEIAEHCLRMGVPYVVTPIFGTPRTLARLRWRSVRQRALGAFPKAQEKLLQNARRIFPLTAREAQNLEAYFQALDPKKFRVVPNGVEARFASGDPEVFRKHFGIAGDFVLHVGSADKNKNQLALIRALKESSIPLYFCGPGGNEYFEQCQSEMTPTMKHLGMIPHDSYLLPGAYAAASVFCLPSQREIFPLSASEATVAGCHIVLGTGWGGEEVWGGSATFVDQSNPAAIRAAIESKINQPRPHESAKPFLAQYSWEAVAKNLATAYEESA